MATEPLTQDGGTFLAVGDGPHAFLVVHVEGGERSRVVDLPEGVDVTFGRSRSAGAKRASMPSEKNPSAAIS